MSDQTAVILGKHCLLERISIGGMAEVFRAKPLDMPGFQRFLAVKRILPHLAEDDEFVTMFVDEARIAVQLHHRNVCQIYELGRIDATYYIVMEFIGGKDLLNILTALRERKKVMSVAQTLYVAAQVCDGLDYAHRKCDEDGRPLNIVHRDVSPQNVLISWDGEVKVIDFGIARAATSNQKTQVGVLKGKFGYMSPEQVDAADLDSRSDIFALGTLVWEMLTARRLFAGDGEFETLEKVRNAVVAPPSEKNRSVPAELDAIVLKALARNRDDRYQTAGELARDLRELLGKVAAGYDQKTLAGWMFQSFPDEAASEKGKVAEFAPLVTADDVFTWNLARTPSDAVDISMDEDEATRVFDSKAPKLPKSPAPTLQEIIARNTLPQPALAPPTDPAIEAPRTTVVGDAVVVDDPVPRGLTGPNVTVEFRTKPTRSPAIWVGLAVALILLAGLAFAALRPRAGALVVQVQPSTDVTVLVNGQPRGTGSPVRLEDLAPGTYLVEVRQPQSEALVESVSVDRGGVTILDRTLTPLAAGVAELRLRLNVESALVFLDGVQQDGVGTDRRLELAAAEEHLVELHATGYFVEELRLDLARGQSLDRTVQLRPLTGRVTIAGDQPAEVWVDGVRRGELPPAFAIDALPVTARATVEVRSRNRGFLPHTETVIFDTWYDQRLVPRLRRIGMPAEAAAPEPAALATTPTTEWLRVFVDDRDTGLVTPVPESAALPLKPGRRVVSFRRGGTSRDVTVDLQPGQTLVLEVPRE